MTVTTIIPAAQGLEVNLFNARQDYIIGVIESIAVASLCPLCGLASTRIQNHYTRQVADLPWGGSRLQLTLSVRKFFVTISVVTEKSLPSDCLA
jgi:transposase